MKAFEIVVKLLLCVFFLVVDVVLVLALVALFADFTQNASIREFYVSEPEDRIVLAQWRVLWQGAACVVDFGDGTQSEINDCYTRRAMFHTYKEPGGYLVTLHAYSLDETGGFNRDNPDHTQTIPRQVPR